MQDPVLGEREVPWSSGTGVNGGGTSPALCGGYACCCSAFRWALVSGTPSNRSRDTAGYLSGPPCDPCPGSLFCAPEHSMPAEFCLAPPFLSLGLGRSYGSCLLGPDVPARGKLVPFTIFFFCSENIYLGPPMCHIHLGYISECNRREPCFT